MRFVTPSTHLIAYTKVDEFALAEMLEAFGAPEDWQTDPSDDAAHLTEIMGRLCYKSFGTEMNPNITKVREGNAEYVGNVMAQKHGSVFEHSTATFGFIDVSPVVTHELVRHRAGTAFSQVSMRFVRLTEIGAYFPKAFQPDFMQEMFKSLIDDPIALDFEAGVAAQELENEFQSFVESAERLQLKMAEIGRLDDVTNFHLKKRFTSSMRRLAPYGLATSIGVTANHRAWRHMIAIRTHRSAEEEIRLVFGDVARKLAEACPNIYQDMHAEHVEGFDEFTFDNSKI